MPKIDAHTWELTQEERMAYGLYNDLLDNNWSSEAALLAVTLVYKPSPEFLDWLAN